MTIHRSPPQFTISTQAAFNENGVWLIDARLRFGRRAARQVGSALLGEARFALIGELTREALRGRALGAKVVPVAPGTTGVGEVALRYRPAIRLF